MQKKGVALYIEGSSNFSVGKVVGDSKNLIYLENSNNIIIDKINHVSKNQRKEKIDLNSLKYSIPLPSRRLSTLCESIIILMYPKIKYYKTTPTLDKENTMNKEDKISSTLHLRNSENIRVGSIRTDAYRAVDTDYVKNVEINEIFHFTKSKEDIERIFQLTNQNIKMVESDPLVTDKAMDFSNKMQQAYLSRDNFAFRQFYKQFTDFLSTHTTLATGVLPLFIQAFNSI